MGCHTWFLKSTGINSPDKIKALAIELLKKTEKDPEQQSRYWKQNVIMMKLALENNLDEIFGEFATMNLEAHSLYHDGKIWEHVDQHDIFRIGGYPEDKLFSYDETENFCVVHNIELDDNQKERLKEFWTEYPDGMIRFG